MNNTHYRDSSIDEDISSSGWQRLAIDRTHLANERTMLAYTRTALALIGLGAFIIHFNDEKYSIVFGILLFVIALIYLIVGAVKYHKYNERIKSENYILNIEGNKYSVMKNKPNN